MANDQEKVFCITVSTKGKKQLKIYFTEEQLEKLTDWYWNSPEKPHVAIFDCDNCKMMINTGAQYIYFLWNMDKPADEVEFWPVDCNHRSETINTAKEFVLYQILLPAQTKK